MKLESYSAAMLFRSSEEETFPGFKNSHFLARASQPRDSANAIVLAQQVQDAAAIFSGDKEPTTRGWVSFGRGRCSWHRKEHRSVESVTWVDPWSG
jgi:hypothetical protein